MSAPAREAGLEYSRGGRASSAPERPSSALRALLAGAGLAGCAALVIADLSTLYEVRASGGVKASVGGSEQHNYSLLVIGLATIPMVLASLRGALPALLAVSGLGLATALIILAGGDLHDIHATGVAGQLYERATAGPKAGFYEETLGAALLLVAGGGGLLLAGPGRGRRDPRARAREQQPGAHEQQPMS